MKEKKRQTFFQFYFYFVYVKKNKLGIGFVNSFKNWGGKGAIS